MNYDAREEPLFQDEALEEIKPLFRDETFEEIKVFLGVPVTGPSAALFEGTRDPGTAVILEHLDPGRRDLVQLQHSQRLHLFRDSPESPLLPLGHMDTVPTEQGASADSGETGAVALRPTEQLEERHDSANALLAAQALEASANVSRAESDKATVAGQPPTQERVDSAQSTIHSPRTSGEPRSLSRSALKLDTSDSGDTIKDSPILGKHVVSIPQGNPNTLPIVQPTSPIQERGAAGSPTRLPSFQQFNGQLRELAEAASIEPRVQRPQSRHHSRSISSATAPSPRLPYHPFAGPIQTSPGSQYDYGARSPTSTISEVAHPVYGSPIQYTVQAAYYADRRRASVATDHPGPYALPASLPSASSTESQGHASSTPDGYSTAHTTPTNQALSGENMSRPVPILPPPSGMPQNAMMVLGGFECDWDGCTAPPFQTQYLLGSHRNVHSSTRPYVCPVEECPRSVGNKGFKRKNEMIRHGLVHNSPGYVCPFCPDKEHRYPRPDNLQRHVRVHHVEKDKDDAALREVLAQRIEGAGKQRRRRTNAHGSISS
ncbi:hypothetical protein LTR57_003561 [Friedmanniomyces endolithicus]|nr:hypothetical protein LTR35_016984 [Friedmanniomyces endolithicus]KAK0927398.1 hypothetical protein LTR57_003561 [Friedmanniomyces endolithicus]